MPLFSNEEICYWPTGLQYSNKAVTQNGNTIDSANRPCIPTSVAVQQDVAIGGSL